MTCVPGLHVNSSCSSTWLKQHGAITFSICNPVLMELLRTSLKKKEKERALTCATVSHIRKTSDVVFAEALEASRHLAISTFVNIQSIPPVTKNFEQHWWERQDPLQRLHSYHCVLGTGGMEKPARYNSFNMLGAMPLSGGFQLFSCYCCLRGARVHLKKLLR